METDAQRPAVTRIERRVCGVRFAHHEARARHDAKLVSVDDAAVYTTAVAEIVGIHDNIAPRWH
jgi:hypothetical protein